MGIGSVVGESALDRDGCRLPGDRPRERARPTVYQIFYGRFGWDCPRSRFSSTTVSFGTLAAACIARALSVPSGKVAGRVRPPRVPVAGRPRDVVGATTIVTFAAITAARYSAPG